MPYDSLKEKIPLAIKAKATMDLSKVKMIVTDMDGTLLNSAHEVSDRFYDLFEKLDALGIAFVAASGRQYGSMVNKLAPIRDRITFVAENGALVKQQERDLLVTPLNAQTITEIVSILDEVEGAHAVLCGRDRAFVPKPEDKFLDKLREYYADFASIGDLEGFDQLVLKIAVYHFEDSETHIYPRVKHLEDALKVKVSGQHWVDLSHLNAHKGFAINTLQARLGIRPEETLVFGDYKNDLEMLQAAGFSFAMENAHPEVTRIARYVTDNNDNYGVENILEQVVKALS